MAQRWTQFADPALQARLIQKAQKLGAGYSLDADGRVWFDDDEWCRFADPHILTLDDEFGLDWVAVYADKLELRSERIRHLEDLGIPHVVWFNDSGAFLVLNKLGCPPGWEHA